MSPEAVSRDELLKRAEDLVPLIRSRTAWSEEHRRPHDDVVEALAGSGMTDLRRPRLYGGLETSARTLVEVISVLAHGDGSTAWNTGVWAIGDWLAGNFPDHVQDEVFAIPHTRICVVLSPTAVATAAPGGLTVNGSWHFMSGAHHSHWQVVIAMAPAPDGSQWPVAALVPMSELEIVDDWHTTGLVGTGSVTTVAKDVFIPQERVLPMVAILQSQYASERNATSPVYNTPMIPTGAAGFIGVAIGLAQAARDEFLHRLPGRKITYTGYEHQADAPVTHFQVAEASLLVDEAEFHAYRMADLLDDKGASGEPWKMDERMRNRGWLGRVVHQSKAAVDVLATASGGSSLYRSVPIQRIQRDIQAFSLHALMHPNTNFELYGRGLCGLEPNTMYL
ncbi:acyl-CoA dehydrogenase [Micromonospora sp. NPDC049051]|uniref:acyl-CoA dehydrogenase n=1 Tax=unclassified Micromonospora TaxID=2617518 RepID=UPI0037154DEC